MGDKQYNPRDRIRQHLKRKSSSRCLDYSQPAPTSSAPVFPELDTESCPAPTNYNPFKIGSPPKKRRPPQVSFDVGSEENAQDSFGAEVLQRQSGSEDVPKPLRTSPRKSVARKNGTPLERFKSYDPGLLQDFHVDFSHMLKQPLGAQEGKEEEFEESEDIPLDLRVGTKVRVVSNTLLPWMNSRKGTGIVAVSIPPAERYDGMKYFNQMYISGAENPTIPVPSSNLSLLEAATLYWQFPVVPGMSLYPRISSELKSTNRVPMAPLATAAMSDQWIECYKQLFMSYKKGERDSFFVASAVFNVLFTKTAVTDDIEWPEDSQSCFRSFNGQKMIALVSHTTSATREHLRNQCVDYEVIGAKGLRRASSSGMLSQLSFTMDDDSNSLAKPTEPIGDKENSNLEPPDQKEEKEANEDRSSSDENESPTKANQQWLKSIGVSPRHIRNTVKRKLTAQSNDEAISCLLVKGSSVQSLYNALMSSDIVHEKTGPYTKIPPTLIATSPFLYGQLLSLNKSSQVIHKMSSKTTEYILELDGGPVLPHCLKMLTKFLRSSDLCKKPVRVQVSDRHSNNGMNEWTNRATNWNTVQIHPDVVKWTKSVSN